MGKQVRDCSSDCNNMTESSPTMSTEPSPLPAPPVTQESSYPGHINLDLLWEMIDRHRLNKEQDTLEGRYTNTTWELVILQAVLIVLLVIVVIIWALCCKRRCRRDDEWSVAEALRKVSRSKRDLPPSYSKADLHSLGISVNDYLHPPPQYLDLFTDNLQYLDLEQGHNRLAKLSFCNDDGTGVSRVARLSVASCENCSHESPVVVPTRPDRTSSSSKISSLSSSRRRQSRTNSRVSFSEEVECSNGSIRRLSTNSLIGLKTDTNSTSHSRRSSSSSEGSRKSSLKARIERKLGSTSNDSFISNLDEELRQKLESIGEDDKKEEPAMPQVTIVTAESQAERAAKICDIVVEAKNI